MNATVRRLQQLFHRRRPGRCRTTCDPTWCTGRWCRCPCHAYAHEIIEHHEHRARAHQHQGVVVIHTSGLGQALAASYARHVDTGAIARSMLERSRQMRG